jgi:hypothetical protein
MRNPKTLKMSSEKGGPSPQQSRCTPSWEQHPEEYVYRIDVAGHAPEQAQALAEYLSPFVQVMVFPGLIETEFVRADQIDESPNEIVAELQRIAPGCKPRVIIYEQCAEVPE